MKLKIHFLTILLSSILSATQAMAEFAPGTYYLQTASGTYINSEPNGKNNPGAKFQSSSATAFTFTQVEGGYTIQNSTNNNYLLYSTAINWDTKMSASSAETNYSGIWTVNEGSNGKISISRQHNNTTYYLGNNNTNVGTGVYSGQTSAVWYTPLTEEPFTGDCVVTGDQTEKILYPIHYITNTSTNPDGSKKYFNVPAGKAWQMEMVVENTNTSGDDPHFNEYGSTILASTSLPFDQKYMGHFQVYQHAPTHNSPNTLNFKASKADGYDHIIAQGTSVANKNYKVIVRYSGDKVYLIRTIILDSNLQETDQVYNNVWVSAQAQNDINQMSCALPEGINLKSLRISIAEESNLLEGVDYAIQNITSSNYLTGNKLNYSQYASDAAKYQIEFTGNNELTYAEQDDGGLHYSFYIKNAQGKYLGSDTTFVDKNAAMPFIYTTNQHIAPITAKNTLDKEWTIGSNNTWLWDFLANFYVEVAGNNNGGLTYIKGNEQKTAHNEDYLELPSGVKVEQLANSSQLGYSASITKSDIRIKVQYTPLENTFYNFTNKSTNASTLYYWYKPENTLVTYSTKNSDSGIRETWGEKGDCSKYTITKVTTIPVKMNKNSTGSNADNKYYGTIYCPNALTLPTGVTAYRLEDFTSDGDYLLKPIGESILPASTPAVLISEAANANDPSGSWRIDASNTTSISETNLFSGISEDTANPGSGQLAGSPIYVLGNQPVNGETNIGFYPYSAAMIPAFKAYHNTQGSQAPARFLFTFDEGNETNAIKNHNQAATSANATYYDLTGRAVACPIHGHLYIRNGKKVIY